MRLKNERHEMRKEAQAVDLAKKEGQIRHQAAVNAKMRVEGRAFFPVFHTMFTEELSKTVTAKEEKPAAAQAA